MRYQAKHYRKSRIFYRKRKKYLSLAPLLGKIKIPLAVVLVISLFIYPFLAVKFINPSVNMRNRVLTPGNTVAVISENTKRVVNLKFNFDGREYPFFEKNEGLSRALIPLSLTTDAGIRFVDVTFKGKLLKKITVFVKKVKRKPIKLRIAAFQLKKRRHPDVKKDSESIRKIMALQTPKQFWQGAFNLPAKGRFSAPFGEKRILPDDTIYFHKGLDIAIVKNTFVRAANNGVVAHTGEFMLNGKSVFINHGQGVFTMYCHLNEFLVKKGDKVTKGQVVAKSGSSGFSNSPHLHWTLAVNGTSVSPLQWTLGLF